MENTKTNPMDITEDLYVKSLEVSNKLSERAIRSAIKELGFFDKAKVLDVPCGIGNQSLWMLENNPSLEISAVDLGEAQLAYAKKMINSNIPNANCRFLKEDINKLPFKDDSFDFVWCCDGLWPGPKEMGCLAEEPYDILRQFKRITKPGGKIAVIFWTSQMLLPGYPYIESALKATKSANRPLNEDDNPELHVLRTPAWLKKVDLKDISVKTYTADIYPLNNDKKVGLEMLFEMFFKGAEQEVEPKIWQKYQELINQESENSICKQDGYAGFLTYTVYVGRVEK